MSANSRVIEQNSEINISKVFTSSELIELQLLACSPSIDFVSPVVGDNGA